MPKQFILFVSFFIIINSIFLKNVIAQPTWTIDPFGKEKKPGKYETRKLGSEKTAEKKFKTPRHIIQNNITHFNYYYNANNKINFIIETATLANVDDFTKLLSFYPYSVTSTSKQKKDLDSIIYKCTAGILLHDLRNDWIDNLYLLIGKAYYFRNDLDTAALTFQFINYNLFPRKKGDDDDHVVGSNNFATGNKISIANTEKQNLLQKLTALPPSRNDALIWLTRTLIEQGEFAESAGLINTLQNDENLPKRLQNDLEEITAYWNYKQSIYDSAAVHLEKALSNASDKEDKARREFLLAQLYELNKKKDKASFYYNKVSSQTSNPLMDIYARLNNAKMFSTSDNGKELKESISKLLKMAKQDKFDSYRDLIYYFAGQLTLQVPDTNNAIIYFDKSVKYNTNNLKFKNNVFLQLGEIAFAQKKYVLASNMYDSLQLSDTSLASNLLQIKSRKSALNQIAFYVTRIETEDSLQRIALLSPADRELFVKKLVKKLRKDKGLKEDANDNNSITNSVFNNNTPVDLFANNNTTKGDWYFYNNSIKAKGFNEFKNKWGNRNNVDNWRRKSVTDANIKTINVSANNNTSNSNINTTSNSADISYEKLMQNIPLTTEKIDSSNNKIAKSLLALGHVYQDQLEDYAQAINTYEEYLNRFLDKVIDGNIYLDLYYCYNKIGNTSKANYYKNLLNTKFAKSNAWQKLNNPASLNEKTKNPEATKIYEDIYNSFIEGKFNEVEIQKKKADSLYGENYWTPQLVYIEALYNVNKHNDSVAIEGLNNLIKKFPTSPLTKKATTMVDVLKRRKEIETYLTNLQVTRKEDDNVKPILDDNQIIQPNTTKNTPVVTNALPKKNATDTVKNSSKDSIKTQPIYKVKDTIKVAPQKIPSIKTAPVLSKGLFVMNADATHNVIMVLEKVDGVYVGEAKNAFNRYNKENYYGKVIDITKENLDATHNLLIISSFTNAAEAITYYEKIKKSAPREVSWLPANKYWFLIISNENLQILKTNKDLVGYKSLLNTQFPNKF